MSAVRELKFECGKKAYLSWQHASWDAKELRRKSNEPKNAYWCRSCQHWHVGTVMGKPHRSKAQ